MRSKEIQGFVKYFTLLYRSVPLSRVYLRGPMFVLCGFYLQPLKKYMNIYTQYMNIWAFIFMHVQNMKHNLSFYIFFLGRIWSTSRWQIGRERQRNCDEIPHPRGKEHLKSFMLLLRLVNIFSIVLSSATNVLKIICGTILDWLCLVGHLYSTCTINRCCTSKSF